MLTVMTFNVWLLLSVVAGTVTGHYLLMSPAAAGSSTRLASTRGRASVDRQRLLETSLFDSTSEGRERGDAPDRHCRQSAANNTLDDSGSGTVSVEIHV